MKPDEDLEIWRRATLLVSQVGDAVGRVLRRQHGMNVTEFLTLLNLDEADGGALRIQDIANAIGLDQSSVSRLIGRIAAQDWLERCVCPDDGRGIYAQITEEGRRKVKTALPIVRDTVTAALDEAGTDVSSAVIVGRLRHLARAHR